MSGLRNDLGWRILSISRFGGRGTRPGVLAAMCLLLVGVGVPGRSLGGGASAAAGCSARLDATRFGTADELWGHHVFVDGLGPRPTASPAHQEYLAWLEARLSEIPGLAWHSHEFSIDRWLEREAALEAGATTGDLDPVRIAGPVPYSLPTTEQGVTAPLVYVPPGQAIADAAVDGKIVLRDAGTGSIPNAAFTALEWWVYDPDLVLTRTIADNYERDWVSFTRNQELQAAGDAGAVGLVFMHSFPHEQVEGHYAPYNGVVWPVPAVYVGVDEGEALKRLAADGGQARLVVQADQGPAPTRHITVTLPGMSEERVVVTSHTDGISALWDNGPLVMLEMARYFARLPLECRPKTLEFGFTTAHLYLAEASAEPYAEVLDHDYEDGTVAMAFAIEHVGALLYEAQPRGDGKPGRALVPTERPEPISWIINEPLLAGLALQASVDHDMRESLALRGADLPGPHLPLHHSMGGEGGAYNAHLIPTAAYVTGPWTLFNPSFGMDALDKDLLYRQTLMFTDYVHLVSAYPREVLAGSMTAQRAARAALCSASLTTLPTGDVVGCEGTPAEPATGSGG